MDDHGLKQLGRYRILRLLGRGAMGKVFLAQDPNIDRLVALKTFCAEEFVSPTEAKEAHRRFQREARSAGALVHPNIVVIYDVGEDGAYSFIAMEYIDGSNLARFTRPDRLLAPHKVLKLGIQAAGALHYAHGKGILHRDIKPANLMVSREGVLKITDFGLAKQFGATVTRTRALVGTPSYIAPEQIRGEDVDGRADLFALGVVLYELLTGARPFGGETVSAVMYNILNTEPVPVAERRPDLPGGLDRVLGRLLAKSPADRYADGAEVARDLETLLLGQAPGGSPDEGGLTETLVSNPVTAELSAGDFARPGTDPHGPISLPVSSARSLAGETEASRGGDRGGRRWVLLVLALLPLLAGGAGAAWLALERPELLPWREQVQPPPTVVVHTAPGATLLVGGRPVELGPGGTVALPPGRGPWILQARSACAESRSVEVPVGQASVELPLERRLTREIEVELVPPPGWRIDTIDGLSAIGTSFRLDACRAHRVRLARAGFAPIELPLLPLEDPGNPGPWADAVRHAPVPEGPSRARLRVELPEGLAGARVRIEGGECRKEDSGNVWDCAPGQDVRVKISSCRRLLWTSFRVRTPPEGTAPGEVTRVAAKIPPRVTLTIRKPGPIYDCEVKLSGCPDSTRRSSSKEGSGVLWRVRGYPGKWKVRCWRLSPDEAAFRTIEVRKNMEYRWEP